MQSSSRLFPVALLRAERCGDLSEDVYRIKAGNSPDPTVELAVTRLGLADRTQDQARRGAPVVLLHGSFSNRRFWYSPKGVGLGATLARAGFDVWIPEMRGHGLSPRNQQYRHNDVAAYARYDLPVINAFVAELSGQRPYWLGHSLGGISLAVALGSGALTADSLAGLALFGSQVSRAPWPLRVAPMNWAARGVLRRLGHIPGPRLKRGPEDEPAGVALEMLRWHGLRRRLGRARGDWRTGLAQARLPLLVVAGGGDHQDPPWACEQLFERFGSEHGQFLVLGQAQGFSQDFGHVDMLVSKAAQSEVWPLVQRWLSAPGRVLPQASLGEGLTMPAEQVKL
ncbi:alpha/beta fold hydrolase [Pseudomonas massiliensis]|uniref:alpha/beta fold hydrolase n=1 Tax=Pseudomonas massiliensis TaxID=522492 RepID=UPI000694927C|nr:alpha/beta fold hydrolase [Pseudomonas massiliensis]